MPNYLSNSRPDFKPGKIACGSIPCYQFKGSLKTELESKRIDKKSAIRLLEVMLTIREFEEMIIKLRSGAYTPLPAFNYRGPTHLSIGQEASSAGACSAILPLDFITSTHRGHGDSIAKGCFSIAAMNEEKLRARVPEFKGAREELLEAAMEDHIFRTAAELFGKEGGYCKGRGGGMHIADFTLNHLGANAIVGGGVPIATGASMASRFMRNDRLVCCFAGDGAYANGVVLESLNWAAQEQFSNKMAKKPFGLPIIFIIQNNHYGMTGRAENEVAGVRRLARRAAGFDEENMHAEVVNGMDVLATRDAVLVSSMAAAGKVKNLVERMKAAGRPEASEHLRIYRPWGWYQRIEIGARFQVKRIHVKEGGQLSLQKHFHRAEHWVVVRGTAEVTLDKDITNGLLYEFTFKFEKAGEKILRRPIKCASQASSLVEYMFMGRRVLGSNVIGCVTETTHWQRIAQKALRQSTNQCQILL